MRRQTFMHNDGAASWDPQGGRDFLLGLGIYCAFLAGFRKRSHILITCFESWLGNARVVSDDELSEAGHSDSESVHGKNGFFQSAGGFEYNLALIGLLLPTLIAGPGKFAIGRLLPLPKVAGTDRPIMVLE